MNTARVDEVVRVAGAVVLAAGTAFDDDAFADRRRDDEALVRRAETRIRRWLHHRFAMRRSASPEQVERRATIAGW